MALDYDALRKKHKKRDEENWAKEKASQKQNSFETTQENKTANKGSYNEKTKVSSSRAGIVSESNTVDASISDRAAARKAAAKKNTQQKITQPGNNSQLPGAVRNSKNDVSVAELAEAKKRFDQFFGLNKKENNESDDNFSIIYSAPKVGLPSINRADNIKEDAEISSIVNRAKGLSDEERKRFLVEEARKRSKSTSNADIVMKQLKRQDAGAWEQEKAEYNYRKENGLLEKNDAKTQHYIDRFYSMSEEERQLVANIYADIEVNHGHKDLQAKNKYTSAVNKLKFEYGYTDEDIEAMRYFYGRYINKKNAKTDDINARLAMDKHPVLESLASIPTGLAGGVMAAGGILDSYIDNKAVEKIGIQDQGIDYNHEFSKMQRQAQSGRDQFTKTHDFMIGGYDVGDLLYNTALSGAESATAAIIPGGAALLAVNAGTSKVNELSQRGISSNKAIAGGLAAAATEMIFESVSIGNFKKMQEVEPNTIMDVVANIAKSMGVNASEEALTEAANIVYDTVMHGDKSDYQMQVEYLVNEKGMTREAAEKKARTGLFGQVGEAALSGAIMGVGFGGVASVPNYIGRSAAIEAMGIQAKKSGMKDEIIAEAKAAPKNSKANKTVNREIKKSEKSGEAISDYKLGLIAVQSNDVALKDTGRFSNVKTEAELEERYQSAIQMKKDKGSDSVKQIQKEYEQAKARIRMQAAAKAEADKLEGAQKTERKANELTRIEITNPTIEVDGKRYSIEGKNFDSKTEEIGDAQTIFKDADGDNAVRFGDGQTMKVSEAVEKMTDETAKEVYKATEGMSPEAANLFISNYDGDTVPEYKDAFNYYFNMGRAGLTAEDIRKDNELYGTYFTAEAQRQIATAGLKSREFKAGVTELTFSRSTKPYKQTVQLIDQWAKESGLEVIILKSSDKVNGYHLQETNRIVLYTEVGGKENILTRTFGHETFHFISENSSAEAEKLRSYVIEALEKNGVDIEKALQKYADITDGEGNNVYSTRESQIDELVADSMFDVFTNKAAIERLANNDRTLAQKIYDKFKDILKIIKSKLKLFDTMNNNPEIRALMNDAESLEQIVNKFHDALDVAKNNYNVHDSGKDAGKNFSFAAAARTRPDVITEAENMEKDGATKEQIWEKLGLIRDASGIWVYEIDDSGMKIFPNGDALIKKEKGYQRMMEIFNKAFVNGEQLTEAEQKEYSELDKKYKLEKKTSWKLEDFVEHDELFHNYPQLRKAGFEFADLGSGKAGTYDPKTNTIYISEIRKNSLHSLPGTAIHEIQHAIQHIDNRANGTSPEYWKKKIADKSRDMAEKINEKKIESIEYLNSLDNELRSRIREINRADTSSAVGEKSEYDVLKEQLLKEDKTGAYKKYLDMSADIDQMTTEWKNYLDSADSMQMYRDTAGEIEAREAASRLKMTADERIEKTPDLGQERAVFAESAVESYEYVGKTEDGVDVFETSKEIKNLSYGDKIEIFLKNFYEQDSPHYLGKVVSFKIGEKIIKAEIDRHTQNENTKKINIGRLNQWDKAKINTGADGDFIELIENARYTSEKKNEDRKKNDAHKRTDYFEYFLKSVYIDDKPFDVVVNLRREDSKQRYVYEIKLKKNKKLSQLGLQNKIIRRPKVQSTRLSESSIENVTQSDSNVKEIFSMNSSEKSLDEMKAERSTLQNEYRELKGQIDNLKTSAEYIAFEDEIRKVRKNGSLFGGFEAVKEIRRQRDEWADEAGLTELQKRYHDISEQIHDYDLAIYKTEKEQKIKATEETAKKVKAFTHDVVMKYATDAAKKFGITKKFENAGYMLPDGKLLDFSDGQGYRVLDHREIKNVLDFLPDGQNYSDGLIQFMNMGNIRMQIGGIDISRMPSNEQIPVLRKFFKENNGEITVDFSKENGDNAGSVEYPAGTSSDRIINDIKSYFTTGNVPKLTGAAAFHAMYSRNGDSAIDAHYGEVVKENKHWRAIVSMLTDEKFSSIRKDVYLNGSDIHRISKELIKKASSKYDLATFENQLTAIFDYIATSKSHVDTDAVFSAIYQLSNDVLGESEIKDTELYEQYADVRKFLHDVEIYIPDNVRKEINSQFGDFKSFRNQLMGKVMHISTKNTNARSLDEVWQELSEIAPEYFPKDMNELDMPMQLTRFFDSIAPKIVNPYEHYEMNIEEEAAVFATEILESYYKIRVEKTDSGKARDIIKEGMRQLQINRKALQNDFKRKEQENADEYRERIAEYKFQRAEGDRRRRLRNEIERNYNYLNRRLVRETDKDRILKQFQPLVSAFRDIVPDSNSRFSRKALTEFENEYRKLEEVSTFYNEDFANIISDFKDRVTGIDVPRMRDIDGYELDVLRNITEHVKYIVQNENRLFSEGLNGRVEEFGKSVHNELFEKKDSKDQGFPERGAKKTDKIRNGVNSFIKGLTKPEYLFEGIGSPTVKALYDELRKGENIEAKIVYDAKLAEQEIKKRNNYDQRWGTQTVTLDLRSGKRNVTIEDVMALYATSRRKQGLEHMLNGGVILYSKKELTKKNGKSSESIKRDTIKFTDEDIRILEKSLTKDQKNYVNDMVEYITKTIGEKRNEVSMKLYGIEKYKESFYFPIKVDRNFVDTSVGKQEVVSTIKNQSSSKRTVDHAKNPIEITGFTDTVNNHVFDSALYCAYVLPINDFKRVYNYREKVYDGDGVESLVPGGVSVKSDIERTSGVNAIKEIERFMISVDSGSRYENLMPFSAKLMARTKKTAVMANLSVVVQQPTAVFRAMLYISPKHFATWANKADIEEMKRWNGCALKKEIGYFDVNMGRSATDYMNEYSTEKSIKEDWSLSDKVKNSNTMLKIDQAAGFLASKADEQTWGAIWKACKKQVKTENPELSGDSLNAAAAELFQTTISKTQVYDSVFTKPEYMRRKEGFAMMATQFMSEPLTSLNMLAESVAKAKNTEKGSQQRKDALKFSARAFGCYITSVVVNSALKGIIYAMRDDDDDETFLEKYISNVAESIPSDILGMVPYFKDILSVVQGYDLNRADVAVFTTMADAIKDLVSDKKTTFEKIMSVMKAAGQASGIPVYNVMRDAKSIIDIAIKIKEGVENGFPETTGRGVLNELKETFDWLPGIDDENNYEQLYSSIVKGDKKHYDRVYNSLVADGKDDSTINGEIAKILFERDERVSAAYDATVGGNVVEASNIISQIKSDGFSDEIVARAMTKHQNELEKQIEDDGRIEQAASARYNMDYDEYERIIDEMVSEGYKENIVKKAIESKKIELETSPYEFEVADPEEYKASYDLKNAMLNGDSSDVRNVHGKLVKEIGKEKADKYVRDYAKDAFKDGKISTMELERYLTNYKTDEQDSNDIFWEMEEIKNGDGFEKYGKLYNAIDNGGNLSATVDYYTSHGVSISSVRSAITKEYKPKLLKLNPGTAEYNEMYENIIDGFVATGNTESKARKDVNKWLK